MLHATEPHLNTPDSCRGFRVLNLMDNGAIVDIPDTPDRGIENIDDNVCSGQARNTEGQKDTYDADQDTQPNATYDPYVYLDPQPNAFEDTQPDAQPDTHSMVGAAAVDTAQGCSDSGDDGLPCPPPAKRCRLDHTHPAMDIWAQTANRLTRQGAQFLDIAPAGI